MSEIREEKFRVNKPGVYEYGVPFDKKGQEGRLVGVIEAREVGEYTVKVLAEHLVPETNGRVEVRGVVENGARVNLAGLIRIAPGASKTDSFLDLKLLMLDDKSYALAEPELEILNNDVKASHSASVGRIDRDQLYYLATRGVGEEEAKRLIVEGFLNMDSKLTNNLE